MVAVQHRSRSVPRQTTTATATATVVRLPSAARRPAPATLLVKGARPPALRPPVARRPVARPDAGPIARPRAVSPSTYRRRQALAAGGVAALSAVVSIVLGALGGGSLTAPERPLPVVAGQVYEVQAGDTFWAIARSLDPDGDPRPIVDRLVAEHGGPVLVVGEQIRLPLRS